MHINYKEFNNQDAIDKIYGCNFKIVHNVFWLMSCKDRPNIDSEIIKYFSISMMFDFKML